MLGPEVVVALEAMAVGILFGAVVMGLIIRNNPKKFFKLFYKPDRLVTQIARVINDPTVSDTDTVESVKHLINIFRGGKKS